MFRTGSPYSPFFTSGLLSESTSSSRSSSPDPELPRRGSLPTEKLSMSASSSNVKSVDNSSAFYFSLQPQRGKTEYRSFLSLDLAESQSLWSVSLRHRPSTLSKVTSGSWRPEKVLFPKYSQVSDSPEHRRPEQPPKSTTLRARNSRDSLRNIPSPKPAPSAILPDLPHISSTPPRLPPIPVMPFLKFPSLRIASHSAPSLVISRTEAPDTVFELPERTMPLSHSASKTSASTTSTRYRKYNRSDALACLEGRSKSSQDSGAKRVARNFMSMSDDEEDELDEDLDSPLDSDQELMVTLITTLEDEDIVIPHSPLNPLHASKSAPRNSSFSSSAPSLAHPPQPRRPKPKRRSTAEWLQLKSFIDLRGDDDLSNWSWRSFIEVAVS